MLSGISFEAEFSRVPKTRLALANLLFASPLTPPLAQLSTRSNSPSMRQGGLKRGEVLKAGLGLAAAGFANVPSAFADGTTVLKLPPIDHKNDKTRCVFESSAMGQANAARDSLYDLRECSMPGATAKGSDISGALMAKGDFSKANFKEAQLSKVYAAGANFDGADFTQAILDRGQYGNATFRGAIFNNAVLSGSSFDGADLTDADFSESYIGDFEVRKICKNPTLQGENPITGNPTRESIGCKPGL